MAKDEELSEADKLRQEIQEKRALIRQAEFEAIHATATTAQEHELELLRAESARLDAKLGTVPKPEDIQQSNQSALDRAKAAAALYDSQRISGTAPMDVATAQVVADESATAESGEKTTKKTPRRASGANSGAAINGGDN